MSSANTPYKQRPITSGRIKAIHVTGSRVISAHGIWSDLKEMKSDWLYPEYGISSTKDLTIAQADHAIEHLQGMLGDGAVRITKPQEYKLKALRELLGWPQQRLWNFIKRQTNQRKSERMLLRDEATSIIIGLQHIYAEGNDELYDKLNRASSGYILSDEGRAELESLKN
jgi:hypothetical protein